MVWVGKGYSPITEVGRFQASRTYLTETSDMDSYDGFLGPGTGSFLMLALIALRGYTLQNATIEAKAYNATTNLMSLFVFLAGCRVIWLVGLTMAVEQLLGARLAAGLIISKGNRLIRPAVITMSLLMSGYLAYRFWF